jgi:hypothetical protein
VGHRPEADGANRIALGGSLAANAHGRGLTLRPLVGDVERFTLVDAQGALRTCSRTQDPELFRLVMGGYGLFGVVCAVTLRLARRVRLERVVEVRDADGLADAFAARIRDGFLYGDFQFDVDSAAPTFLRRGVFSCYRPADRATLEPRPQRELRDADLVELLHLAHIDKRAAFERYAAYYLSTSGQQYWSDTHQLAGYPEGYHDELTRRLALSTPGTEMISELYVPRHLLGAFLDDAAGALREAGADVIYGTIASSSATRRASSRGRASRGRASSSTCTSSTRPPGSRTRRTRSARSSTPPARGAGVTTSRTTVGPRGSSCSLATRGSRSSSRSRESTIPRSGSRATGTGIIGTSSAERERCAAACSRCRVKDLCPKRGVPPKRRGEVVRQTRAGELTPSR